MDFYLITSSRPFAHGQITWNVCIEQDYSIQDNFPDSVTGGKLK